MPRGPRLTEFQQCKALAWREQKFISLWNRHRPQKIFQGSHDVFTVTKDLQRMEKEKIKGENEQKGHLETAPGILKSCNPSVNCKQSSYCPFESSKRRKYSLEVSIWTIERLRSSFLASRYISERLSWARNTAAQMMRDWGKFVLFGE